MTIKACDMAVSEEDVIEAQTSHLPLQGHTKTNCGDSGRAHSRTHSQYKSVSLDYQTLLTGSWVNPDNVKKTKYMSH